MADKTRPSEYRELIIHRITGDFRTSIKVVMEKMASAQ